MYSLSTVMLVSNFLLVNINLRCFLVHTSLYCSKMKYAAIKNRSFSLSTSLLVGMQTGTAILEGGLPVSYVQSSNCAPWYLPK